MRIWLAFIVLPILCAAYAAWAGFGYVVADYLFGEPSGVISSGNALSTKIALAGQWGDSFGVFNAFVSAAGFSIILFTLLQQQKATKEQAIDLHRQRFDSSFFELLKLMRELRGEVSFDHSKEFVRSLVQGHNISAMSKQVELEATQLDTAAIEACTKEIHFWLTKQGIASGTKKDELVNIYMRRVHSKSEATLGPYFRVIYTILRRIQKDGVLSNDEKINYGNLLRSQLTSPEIVLLAVNGLSPISNDMRLLLEEFRMLKYMTGVAWRNRLRDFYATHALEGRD